MSVLYFVPMHSNTYEHTNTQWPSSHLYSNLEGLTHSSMQLWLERAGYTIVGYCGTVLYG